MRLRLILLLVLAALPIRARASVVVPLDFAALTDGAEQVVHARVESQVARWTTDHTAIYTEVTLRVLRPLKGGATAGDVVVMRREGGVVGNVGMRVSGAVRLSDGEEVVLFLERRGAALWTVGMAQGKLHVALVDGQKVALRSTAGLQFLRPESAEPTVMSLDEVEARVAARAVGR